VFALALADTVGAAFTVMVRCAEPEHPFAVAVTVYVVVVAGLAIGFDILELFKLFDGVQTYVAIGPLRQGAILCELDKPPLR
jgi:hypothetical protein